MRQDAWSADGLATLGAAQALAVTRGHALLRAEHLLAGCAEADNVIQAIELIAPQKSPVIINQSRLLVERITERAASLQIDPLAARIMDETENLARRDGRTANAVHLLAILAGTDGHAAYDLLRREGITAAAILNPRRPKLQGGPQGSALPTGGGSALPTGGGSALPTGGKAAKAPKSTKPLEILPRFATDLTARAASGQLDPVIGRDEEIRRAIQILSRRSKNNPVLVGEAGVGKTAIAEGLARRMVDGDVPVTLRDRQLYAVDMGALVAGAKFKGEFEERLKGLLAEVETAGTITLFIDEMHLLMGAGGGGNMDAANLMKPALSRGGLQVIGATTLDEYKKHVEKDPALVRRFQPIHIAEPSVDDTISILRGIKHRYEAHHGIRIADSALVAAAQLSQRYIWDRRLPDKAIDLLDEAASRVRVQMDSKPEALDRLDRRLLQLKIEIEALAQEADPDSQARLRVVEQERAQATVEADLIGAGWTAARAARAQIQALDQAINEAEVALAQAKRDEDMRRAADIQYGTLPELERQRAKAETLLSRGPAPSGLTAPGGLKAEINGEDIAAIISRICGVPMSNVAGDDRAALKAMGDDLSRRVLGQKAATDAVAAAIKRARAGVADPTKPIGSFLFIGPTGVGKTEIAKALAELLFGDDKAMLRLDMSEYAEKHTVSRLIGPPPGYAGFGDSGGALTEPVRRRPYQVVLFDEVEKAHPDIYNVLLQVLDDGRLTDSESRTVSFANTVIIMTSNLGLTALEGVTAMYPGLEHELRRAVLSYFKPELINRLDALVPFFLLPPAVIAGIVDIQVRNVAQRLDMRGVRLTLDAQARAWLAEKGYAPEYGGRELRRVIQRELLDPVADLLLDLPAGARGELAARAGADGLVLVFSPQ
jgi:ATP-dependent Clp protease ATP-binding subunit ClpB